MNIIIFAPDDGRQRAVDPQVRDRLGMSPACFAEAAGQPQCHQERDRHQHAVGVQKREMKELRIHWRRLPFGPQQIQQQQAAADHDRRSATLNAGQWYVADVEIAGNP